MKIKNDNTTWWITLLSENAEKLVTSRSYGDLLLDSYVKIRKGEMLANRCLPFDVGEKKTFIKVFFFHLFMAAFLQMNNLMAEL